MLGNIKSNLDFRYDESAKRRYIADMGIKQAPGIIVEPNIPEETLFNSLVDLIVTNRMFYGLLFKLNETIQSFGYALLTLEAHHPHFILKLHENNQDEEIRNILKRLTIPLGENAYSTTEFYANFRRLGGTIELRPMNQFVQQVLVFIDVQPDEQIIVLGTGELINENSLPIGILCPTQIKEVETAIQTAKIIVKKLISQYNFTGSFSCEFIRFENNDLELAFKNDNFSENAVLWATNFYTYFTQHHNYFLLLKYSARSIDVDKDTLVHIPPLDRKPKFKYLKQINGYDVTKLIKQKETAGNYVRVGLYVWGLCHDHLKFLEPKTIDSICINNQILLAEDGTGTLVNNLGYENHAIFSMLALSSTFQKAINSFIESLQKFGKSLGLGESNNFEVNN